MTPARALRRLTSQEQARFCEALATIELMTQNVTAGYVNLARRRAAFAAELLGVSS